MGWAFVAGVAAAGILAAVGIAWDAAQWGGNRTTLLVTDLSTTVAPLLAAAACAYTARRQSGRSRVSWALLSGGCLAWALGNAAWTYYNFRTTGEVEVPFPSWADAGYLAFIPLAVAGILRLPVAHGAGRMRAVLDGLIIAAALLFLSWATVLQPVYQAYPITDGASMTEALIGIAYPVGDVILLSVLLMALSRTTPATRRPLWWLLGGFTLFLVSDSVFLYLTATGTYGIGQYVGDGWLVGFLLIGLGALRTRDFPAAAAANEQPSTLLGAAVPLVPLLAASAMAVHRQLVVGYLDAVLFWCALVVVLAAVLRQFLTILSERRLALEEADALARTRAAEATRIQLINNVAHDVGTPLTPILLQMAILERHAPSMDPQAQHSIEVVRRNANHLKALLGDFLDVARMDAGRLRILPRPMDLAAAAHAAVDSFAEQASQRGVTLALEAPAELRLQADPDRVAQVLYNLLTNALKFTPRGGRVTVRVEPHDTGALVTVADTGRGFAPELGEKLFKPFSQLHDPGSTPERGTGLGLYISRGIVQGHGGLLVGASPGPGLGATFRLTLPAVPPAHALERHAPQGPPDAGAIRSFPASPGAAVAAGMPGGDRPSG